MQLIIVRANSSVLRWIWQPPCSELMANDIQTKRLKFDLVWQLLRDVPWLSPIEVQSTLLCTTGNITKQKNNYIVGATRRTSEVSPWHLLSEHLQYVGKARGGVRKTLNFNTGNRSLFSNQKSNHFLKEWLLLFYNHNPVFIHVTMTMKETMIFP